MKYYLVLGNSSKTFVLSCDKNILNIGRNSDVLVFLSAMCGQKHTKPKNVCIAHFISPWGVNLVFGDNRSMNISQIKFK